MNPQLAFFLSQLLAHKYLIAFPLAIVEGPILMVACGFLLRLGFFSFWPIYLVLILGDFTADLGWYAVGYYGARPLAQRWGKYFGLTETAVEKITELFRRHQNKILFLSKITMGLGFALATLITAGMARVPFKNYAWLNFLGGFIWTGLLLAVGYFFGQVYTYINQGLRLIFIIGLITLLAAALFGFSRFVKQKVLSNKI